ncbi:hypothetical protein QJS10_CPA07g01124 [Acorus calamus]|uniref:Uncharacterized protein n=1 Tax=Acorus calamus TaxID=4465 RepID=A0AAV9EIL5_ACOCL|nr:hypothetical protein QJS10_CPA07g01124 [Acorus calamus]
MEEVRPGGGGGWWRWTKDRANCRIWRRRRRGEEMEEIRRICGTAVTDDGPLRMVGSGGGDGAGWPDLLICG